MPPPAHRKKCRLPFTASTSPPFLREYILFFHKNKSLFTSYGPANAEGHESQRFYINDGG